MNRNTDNSLLSNEQRLALEEIRFIQNIMFEAEKIYTAWERWFIAAESILIYAASREPTPSSHLRLGIALSVLGIALSICFFVVQRGSYVYAVIRINRWRRLERLFSNISLGNNLTFMQLVHTENQEVRTRRIRLYRLFTTWTIRKSVPVIFVVFWFVWIYFYVAADQVDCLKSG